VVWVIVVYRQFYYLFSYFVAARFIGEEIPDRYNELTVEKSQALDVWKP